MDPKVMVEVIIMAVIALGVVLTYPILITKGRGRVVVATTTSLYDTGLLDAIDEGFKKKYGMDIYFISVGTGLALKHAERGDADVVLVHAPSKEIGSLKDGVGVVRKVIAYNFFVIVGPKEDPAKIRGLTPADGLTRIVEAGRSGLVTWISRGDESGTHAKEKGLWKAAGLDASKLKEEPWYIESGTGMGKALTIAEEKSAYTLADMGTYLKYCQRGLIGLETLVGKGKGLLNVYSVMAVSPRVHPNVNFGGALTFIEFLVSEEGQRIIGDYGKGEFSQTLFYPVVRLLKEDGDPTLRGWIEEYAFFDGTECPVEYRLGHEELYD